MVLTDSHVIAVKTSVGCQDDECRGFIGLSWLYDTEAEAIAAWNTRTPIEYDGWFYLPKPKDGIVQYGEPEMTRTENGYKVRQTADVVAEAARKWGDELGEYVMRRICETWNTRSAGTCENANLYGYSRRFECSACGYSVIAHNCEERIDEIPNYCPNCGAKVVTA